MDQNLLQEPWPISMTTVLLRANHTVAREQEYYGPYNTILTHVFRWGDGYMVSPQTHPNHPDSIDYLIEYIVMDQQGRVVGAIEIKREFGSQDDSFRRNAHIQIIVRFRSMENIIMVPTFVIISAIGRVCRVYQYTREGRIFNPPPNATINMGEWGIDISTLNGRLRLNNAFNVIKQNAQTLND
ncbi:hypothetical protein CONCODRAFT_9157 [Conidiobolus coronatus NRRL 28638]|uniref:Uncharacterized protein n=1 Tax=Conidiobolus coronatus (strain ATCC 28846 / CBS 209.66 / NRRL 28638) TaxID=796925 RepID=A0A137P0N7_CONC2|nr:hypothetical protein CONCODRAFT_9157 [Conidiobolus coronatus NRRL 28638]|eukprot:KXN68562.1 hypothetical protein CONCODRAFT_9157 [Conidiobolus coronatus NRRL 28638]